MKKKIISFGTDGWRAIIAREFTFENVKKVTLAISKFLKEKNFSKKPVVVGYDNRFLGEHFAQEIAQVLASENFKVFLCDVPTPTPVIAYAVLAKQAGGALMLTASHNPPEYQGIKFIPEYAGPAFKNITEKIEKNLSLLKIKNLKDRFDSKLIKLFNPKEDYFKHLFKLIDFPLIKSSKFRIVFDAMFGVGKGYLDELLIGAGHKVEVIRGWRDPLFGGILPEPKKETLKELMTQVKKFKADLGLANDGDADRFGVVDETGNFVSPEAVGVILLNYLAGVKKIKGAVVKTVAMTSTIEKVAKKFGLKVYTTPVGFKHIAEIMLREPVIIGCEQSSGLSILGHIPEKDGILAGLLVLEMMAYYQKPLSKILKDLKSEFGDFYNESFNLSLPEEKKSSLIQKLKKLPPKNVFGSELKKIVTIDGLKLIYQDFWFLLRPSGTEPLLRVYLEANSKNKLEKIKNFLVDLIEKFIN